MGEATTDPVLLPPGPRIPKLVAGLGFVVNRDKGVAAISRRYGSAFTLNLPIFGKSLVISDPVLIKDLFTTSSDVIARAGTLGDVFGPGSTFSLEGVEHRQRRKLLVPPFHGKRMQGYEGVVEQEVMREVATWPEDTEFATLPSMMRITLNAILRTVFGAEGEAFEELRELLPHMILRASRLAVMPTAVRRDLGRFSPWGRVEVLRRRYRAIVARLIAEARADDAALAERNDVLALLLQARYDDGSPITDDHVADELLTLLAAGHETTATTLAWSVERLRRHPSLLDRLAADVAAGDSDLLQATVFEVQRTRPVINATARVAKVRMRLGEWVVPEGHSILVSISMAHRGEAAFPDAARFDPDRFVGSPPDTHSWIPFGGGVRRCIGAAFANMEMMVTLRTLLREFDFVATDATGERLHSRGIATAPGDGGVAVVRRRPPGALRSVDAGVAAVTA